MAGRRAAAGAGLSCVIDVHSLPQGGQAGLAYVAWQTSAPAPGYATYLRPFSIQRGWLGPAIKVSGAYGNPAIWPGDTFGIALLPGGGISLTWGSAVGTSKHSAIYSSVVTI
jgi:hypothetical protein